MYYHIHHILKVCNLSIITGFCLYKKFFTAKSLLQIKKSKLWMSFFFLAQIKNFINLESWSCQKNGKVIGPKLRVIRTSPYTKQNEIAIQINLLKNNLTLTSTWLLLRITSSRNKTNLLFKFRYRSPINEPQNKYFWVLSIKFYSQLVAKLPIVTPMSWTTFLYEIIYICNLVYQAREV